MKKKKIAILGSTGSIGKNSLEIIKIASKGIENKVKIISKIYYKYPDLKHQRFRPMVNQIDEIVPDWFASWMNHRLSTR